MRVLIVGDIHLSDRSPSIRHDSYAEEVLAKLEFTSDLAKERAVDAVVWAGDVFHIKTPSRTSHALVQSTIDIGKSYDRPWLIVPGNHDMQHNRLDSLDSQPLGTLFKAGAECLDGKSRAIDGIYGVPFLPSFDTEDWKGHGSFGAYVDEWQASEHALMVTHAPIVPPWEDLPYNVIKAAQWAAEFKRSGSVYYGHMHHCDGDYAEGEFTFCNQGALSRGSLHESTLARKPAVTLWTTEDGFERIEVPHRPVEEVFAMADKVQADAVQARLGDFLSAVGSTSFEKLSVESVLADIESKDIPAAVQQEIRECLEEVMS